MTYSIRSIASFGILLLAFTGCDKEESLGEYTDSATDGSTDATTGTATDPSADSGTDAGSATDTGSATDSGTDAGTDTGPSACGPGSCMTYPYDCSGDACGGLSRFDDDGCVRPNCGDDADCGAGERCYRAIDFGQCESSEVFCEDDLEAMICACGGTDDCGGAYCVAEEFYPVPEAGPTDSAVATDDCAPDDGPAMSFYFGLASQDCGGPTNPMSPVVHIRIDYFDQTPGDYDFGQNNGLGQGSYDAGDGVNLVALAGTLTIDSWDMAGASGSYEIVLEDGTYLTGDFADAAYCPDNPLCG